MAATEQGEAAIGAHLVGGLDAPSAEDAMRTASRILGRHLRAVSDGETGERRGWIGWQVGKLTSIDGIEIVGTRATAGGVHEAYSGFPELAVALSVDELPPRSLGYADAARESYEVFKRLRDEGVIPAEVKFQLSVPTAYANVVAWIRDDDQERFFDVYARALAGEVEEISRFVDPGDLVVQYDVCLEIGALEGSFIAADALVEKDFIVDSLRRALAVPAQATERGLHFCYGDYEHRHFAVPQDLSLCVEVANAVADALDFVHMPADRETGRDPRYFEPLRDLTPCRLALGVIDYEGDEQRTRELIASAVTAAVRCSSRWQPSAGWRASTIAVPAVRLSSACSSFMRRARLRSVDRRDQPAFPHDGPSDGPRTARRARHGRRCPRSQL